MQQLDSDLWIHDAPLRFVGLEVGARMTVVRLPESKLFLHSPVGATEEILRAVEALGTVTYLIAPNKFHHLFVADWLEACPESSVYVAPGLDVKRSDLKIAGVLTDTPEPGWADTIDQILVDGFSLANEVVFFHRPSATVIAADLAFNIGPGNPTLTRFLFRMMGTYGRLSATPLERLFIRDRPAFRRSLKRILEWPFERVIVAHGDVSESGGREEIERSYAWILDQTHSPRRPR